MPLARPKAILFDMDDTILNSSGKAAECWQRVAERFAPACGISPDALYDALVQSSRWYWSDSERHRVGRLDMMAARRAVIMVGLRRCGMDDGAELAVEMAHALRSLRDGAMCLFPEAVDVLTALQAFPITLALVTNGEKGEQRAKIERFALAPYFSTIVVEGEFGIGKPDERVYRHTLAEIGAAPNEAWMVGDNLEWDVLGPQRIGMRGIWRDPHGTGLPPGASVRPDRIIRSLHDLLDDVHALQP